MLKTNACIFIAAFIALVNVCYGFLLDSKSPHKVQVLLTTGDQSKLLSKEPDLYPSAGNGPEILIDKAEYQRMEGFGAAFSNSAAYVIYNSPKRHEIMRQLFSPIDGIGNMASTKK